MKILVLVLIVIPYAVEHDKNRHMKHHSTTRMCLLDLVFEYKEILSDKEYLSVMNLK